MTYTDWNAGAPGQQPGQPGVPGQPGLPGQPPVPPQPAQKSGVKKLLAIGGPILVAGVVGVRVLGLFGGGDPEVGDCVKESGEQSWDVVDCDSGEAQYKVVGVEEDQQTYPEFESDPDTCTGFPEAEFFMWIGPDGSLGNVYCAKTL